MALGARDIYIILRARDEASRTIQNAGRSMRGLAGDASTAADKMLAASTALIGVGTSLAAAGAAGVAFFSDATKSALDFSNEAARTLTQTTGRFEATVEDMKNIVRRVATDIPAPFEEMMGTLYFIFSSTNAGIEEAEELLRGFSKEAVAGQTTLEAVARSSIAIINAFGYGYEELERIQDMQFETVRKGIITYEELSSVIGRAIPATARAGQEVEMLGASLAFLTRNGLSAEMASTSAARGFEAFARPAVAERLKEMGISIADATGEFRPFNEVITDLGKKMEQLPGPERAAALHELFKGAGGTIQARRFIDMAVKNYEEFNQHVQWQMNNAGAFANAYEIMSKEPAAALQRLKNAWEVLKTEIGDEFLDTLARTIEWLTGLVQSFRDMDPELKSAIVRFGAIASAIMVVIGVIMVVTGVVLGFLAMMSLAGIGFAAMGVAIGVVIGVIAALIAIGYLLITHWDTIKEVAGNVWNFIKDAASAAWEGIQDAVAWAWQIIEPIWNSIVSFLEDVFIASLQFLKGIWDEVWSFLVVVVEDVWSIIEPLWNGIVGFISDNFVPALEFLSDVWKTVWDFIAWAVETAWDFIKPLWDGFVSFIKAIFAPTINFLWDVFKVAWHNTVEIVKLAWSIIRTVWDILVAVIRGVIVPAVTFLWDQFKVAWELMGHIVRYIWNTFLAPIWDQLVNFVRNILVPTISWLADRWKEYWEVMSGHFSDIWNGILTVLRTVGNGAIDLVEGLINSVINGINSLLGLLNKLPGVDIQLIGNVTFRRLGAAGPGGNRGAGRQSSGGVTEFHEGGVVEGGDNRGEVDAKLLSREGVVNRRGMAAIGKKGLELINRGTDVFRKTETGDFVSDFFSLGKRALQRAYSRYVEPRLSGDTFIHSAVRGVVGTAFDKVFGHVEENAYPQLGPGIGYQAMWQAVSKALPFARFTSGFRPGAVTATGNPSYHGMGRAIDIAGRGYMNHSDMLAINKWIYQRYKSATKELIYSGRGAQQVWNGRDHYYTGVTRRNHFDHVHWAMRKGGKVLRGPARTLVGEDGPEVLDLPTGSQVTPLGDTSGVEEKLDQLIALLSEREPVNFTIETRDDPHDIAKASVLAMRMR